MIRFARFTNRPLLCAASVLIAAIPAFAGSEGATRRSADKDTKSLDSMLKITDEAFARSDARIAKEQYDKKSAEIALRIDDAVASSQENAAFLYYQAFLARRVLDPCNLEPFDAVLRGEEPDARVRVYRGQSRMAVP